MAFLFECLWINMWPTFLSTKLFYFFSDVIINHESNNIPKLQVPESQAELNLKGNYNTDYQISINVYKSYTIH